ncbi:hypothetical protein [uncultured Shimia sp.]|uniref:capsular polysaccharide export protein, LipB/KpsS family n=1 Tax=uncultured Shimia sp. TaxID=573152 RepID=UPI00261E8573|nr:hypothetical protein [uncultured Shimia sp.]
MPFYAKALDGFAGLGIPTQVIALDRDTVLRRIEQDNWFHILNHSRLPHARALMAGVAYIYPYWNLDPLGIRAFSSIGDKPFRPAKIDGDTARSFLDALRQKWVVTRTSRYEQPEARATDLPDNPILVVFQSEADRSVDKTCYMDRWQMLETCLEADHGPVVVKPHPRDLEPQTFDRLLKLKQQHDHLYINTGNIHDLLDAATRVVTINSAVGLEAYLHRKPVTLCGQSDFHHIADTATSPDVLRGILKENRPGRVYAKYLY